MAEFPDLGKHCAYQACNQLDFLPVICDACKKSFCNNHFRYEVHNCVEGILKDKRVPICPVCNQPIAVAPDQSVDVVINRHIEENCTVKQQKTSFLCELKGCKKREFIEVRCSGCKHNFCLMHRFPDGHFCTGRQPNDKLKKKPENNSANKISMTPNTDNDESLARALNQLWNKGMTDEELARRLQAQDFAQVRQRPIRAGGNTRNNGCILS